MIIDKRKRSLYSKYVLADVANPFDVSVDPNLYIKIESILRLVHELGNSCSNVPVVVRDGKAIRSEDIFNLVEVAYFTNNTCIDGRYVTEDELDIINPADQHEVKTNISVYTELIENGDEFLKVVVEQSEKHDFFTVGNYLKKHGYLKHVPTSVLWVCECMRDENNGGVRWKFSDINKNEIDGLVEIVRTKASGGLRNNCDINISWEFEEHRILNSKGKLTDNCIGNGFFDSLPVTGVNFIDKGKGLKAIKTWFLTKWLNLKIWAYRKYWSYSK